jgi:soluble lytic murein transglycosylase-like protein
VPLRRTIGAAAIVLGVLLLSCACGSTDGDPALGVETDDSLPPPAADLAATTPTTTSASSERDPGAVAGLVPELAEDPAGLAEQLEAAETVIRDDTSSDPEVAQSARLQQVAYRTLAARPQWHEAVIAALPAELREAAQLNIDARLEFSSMNTNPPPEVPAWRIVPPAPADELVGYYREAEDELGVEWEYLAAINLVETGMGRIRGDSSAGAQGPMQFIPSTWARFGEGDIQDPHDAIFAAARYLAHNGGGEGNIDGALFNYNNDVRYVRGVTAYAQVIQADPDAYRGFHQWQVWYASAAGDLVLPEGYHRTAPQPAAEYARQHPDRLRPT